MAEDKLNLWQYMQYYVEDEYLKDTELSPYVEGTEAVPTFEYIKWIYECNADAIGKVTDAQLQAWYDTEVKPMLEHKRAPEIKDLVPRVINVYFIKEYKFFFNKHNKKTSIDYVLNVDKLIDEKTGGAPPVIFNNVQTFMLNYEIKKLLDKAITIVNEKYCNIIYINGRLSSNGILNTIGHLEKTYKNYEFNYVLLDRENEFSDIASRCNRVQIVKTLF